MEGLQLLGQSPRKVSEHKSTQMLRRYTHVSPQALVEAIRKNQSLLSLSVTASY